MAASQTQIREELAKVIAGHFGDGVQVSARPKSSPTPPALYVRGGPVEYDKAMGRGHDEHELTLVAFVANVTDEGSQLRLDEFMAPAGPRSVKQAAEKDPDLGGLVHDLRVERCSGPITYTFDTLTTGTQRPPVLGAEWLVRVLN